MTTGPIAQLRKAAHRWLVAYSAQDLPPNQVSSTLADCSAHLQRIHAVPTQDAYAIALSAWSEVEGARTRCYVDLDLSTPHLIFIVDPLANTRHPFPVVDLVRLLGPRAVVETSSTKPVTVG